MYVHVRRPFDVNDAFVCLPFQWKSSDFITLTIPNRDDIQRTEDKHRSILSDSVANVEFYPTAAMCVPWPVCQANIGLAPVSLAPIENKRYEHEKNKTTDHRRQTTTIEHSV
jgi:hypothetical protein